MAISTTKKRLIEANGRICKICNKEIKKSHRIELDHIIPIAAGGKEFDEDNMRLLCTNCHKEKSKTDNIIINTLKKLNVIHKSLASEWTSTIPLNGLRKLYQKLLILYQDSTKKYEDYLFL